MRKQNFILALAVMLWWGCNSATKDTVTTADTSQKITAPIADSHHAQNSLDWSGTYKGLTPCADCEGIETELTINQDGSYLLKTSYKGKEMNNFAEKGNFKWDETGSKIKLDYPKENPYTYFVGENTLTQLDMEGKKITGPLAEYYVLKK